MKYNLIVNFRPEQNQKCVSCEESQTRHIKQYMLENLPSKTQTRHALSVTNTNKIYKTYTIYIKSNLWIQLLYLPAENKHCCSNYNTKQQKSEYIYIYTLAPNTNYHQIKITKTKTWKLQTCIDNKVEKVEDLLRGPTVLRHSHLYPNQLNLIISNNYQIFFYLH
jgi:hypothetical protein